MPQYVIYYEEGETNGPFSIFLSGSSGLTLYSSSVSLAQLQAGFIITFDDNIPSSSVLIDTQAYGCDVAQQLTFPTPTFTRTPSMSVTPSITVSPSLTPTTTPSITLSPSLTPTITPSITLSVSRTPSLSSGAPIPSLSLTPSLTPTRTPSTTPPAGALTFIVTNPGTNPHPVTAGNGSASGTISNTTASAFYIYVIFNSGGNGTGSIGSDSGTVNSVGIPMSGTITGFGQTIYSATFYTLNAGAVSIPWSISKQDGLSSGASLGLGYSTSPGGAITPL